MDKTWSAQQLSIFDWFKNTQKAQSNLVVRARAGTGKTTTILSGVDMAPEAKILVCAFNKRIQVEIAAKLKNPRAEAKTFHALGYSFIRRVASNVRPDDKVEMERAKSVVTAQGAAPDDVAILVSKLLGKAKNAAPFATVADIERLADDFDLTPSEETERSGWNTARVARCVRDAMDISMEKDPQGRISFDDMVWLPVVCGLIKPWFDMVIVDEAQDTNICQLLIAQGACKKGGRLVVVGDDRQAIYGFRGADSGSIDRLKKELNAVELPLNTTYRCPKSVVALAQTLVPDYMAADTAPQGLVDGLDYDKLFDAARVGDFVLSRKNAPLMAVCMGFLRRGIRARIEGREVGAGLVALVKKMKSPSSMVKFLDKLTKWKDKEILRAQAQENTTRMELVTDQYETLVTLAEGLTGVPELEARITSLFEDSSSNPAPAIVCSSVHKAKGLESERVFVLQYTLFPGKRRDIEECNIAYVAYTRAKHHLTLVNEAVK